VVKEPDAPEAPVPAKKPRGKKAKDANIKSTDQVTLTQLTRGDKSVKSDPSPVVSAQVSKYLPVSRKAFYTWKYI